MTVTAVPTLAQIAAQPELIGALPPAACAAFVIETASLQQRLAARIAAAPASQSALPARPDELLDVEEAARRLGISPETLTRRARQAPFDTMRVDLGIRALRFSSTSVQAYIQQSKTELGSPAAPSILPRGRRGSPGRPAPFNPRARIEGEST